ncbi:MAG: hypothetical protein BZY82_01665 [SAR202 cluster bacterium Io17-Chloro-G3]|nr:MAG: hypothetical protein BZY82_01665 [SAR202 cluster bacterium Io17-Chloro-G3]
MSSKTLAGYLLGIGPIVMLAVFIFLFDALIGGAEEDVLGEAKIKADIAAGMENYSLIRLLGFLGGGGMLAMMLGYTLWARLLQGEGKKGATLATVASIAIPVAAAGMMMSMDFNFAAMNAWDKGDTSSALILGAVGEYAGADFIWMFLMISVGFIGLATVLQLTDKVSRSIGGILAVVTLVMFVGWFSSFEGLDFLWMIWMAATVAAGVNLIRQKA